MHPTVLAATDPHRLARAFLALGDDLGGVPQARSLHRAVAAFAAALLLAVAAPLTLTKVGDPPAATLGGSKAVLAAADDEDGDPAG